jgi:SAM-dependent methyltransferase
MASMTKPLCPVTGEPAVRLVQWVGARFLAFLWKTTMRTNARPSFGGVERFGLWESPTGLYFFDPPTVGDHEFYTGFYNCLLERKLWRTDARRQEFVEAARRVKPGDRVLDVGCGFASFRYSVPHASYTGLDPNFAGHSKPEHVRDELLQDHLKAHAGVYDMVCAFAVVEHVENPVTLFTEMVQAARPGGLVIVSVPHVPSAPMRIPNFLINAPPHHLTWWTRSALAALAARCSTEVEAIDTMGWDQADSLMYWIERCSLIRCKDRYYSKSPLWLSSEVVGYLGGRILHALKGVPTRQDEGSSLMLVARRP